MIVFPKTVDEALAQWAALEGRGVYRAGGSDLSELRAHPRDRGPLIDLRDLPGLDSVAMGDAAPTEAPSEETPPEGETPTPIGAWIGARANLASLAEHPQLQAGWPGLAQACGALATPQIRAVATLGGNLMQAPRCSYYRHPDYHCLRRGGDTCYARGGDHLWHVAFDRAPCAAPHPSTVAMALLAYDAELELLTPSSVEPQRRSLAQLFAGEQLEAGALITSIGLPPPLPGERSAYVRASNREYAEWALVEVSARVRVAPSGELDFVALAAGAVAPTPLRLSAVEAALLGQTPTPELLAKSAALAREGATPLPMTAYKLELLEACVLEALEQALASEPSPLPATPDPSEGA